MAPEYKERALKQRQNVAHNTTDINASSTGHNEEILATHGSIAHGDDLSDYVRKRPKRFYVGGFKSGITAEIIHRHVESRGPRVSQVTILPSRTPDSVIIRLNVESDVNCNMVEDPGFWPKNVVCKPWVSRGALQRDRRYRNRNAGYRRYDEERGYSAPLYNSYPVDHDVDVD